MRRPVGVADDEALSLQLGIYPRRTRRREAARYDAGEPPASMPSPRATGVIHGSERGAIVDVAEAAETVLRDREHDDRES
jgi:hypothetical protein